MTDKGPLFPAVSPQKSPARSANEISTYSPGRGARGRSGDDLPSRASELSTGTYRASIHPARQNMHGRAHRRRRGSPIKRGSPLGALVPMGVDSPPRMERTLQGTLRLRGGQEEDADGSPSFRTASNHRSPVVPKPWEAQPHSKVGRTRSVFKAVS